MLKSTFRKILWEKKEKKLSNHSTDTTEKQLTLSATIGKRVPCNGSTAGHFYDDDSVTPHCLMYYAVQHDDIELLESMLTEHNYININLLNDDGIAVIHFAAMVGATASIPIMAKYGANIDLEDIRGNTPLHYALLMKKYNFAGYLLNNGAKSILI